MSAPKPQNAKRPGYLSPDNLFQGPPLSESAPELDQLLNEIIDEMANEAAEASDGASESDVQSDDDQQQ